MPRTDMLDKISSNGKVVPVNYLEVMFDKQLTLQKRLNNLPDFEDRHSTTEFIRKNILYTIDELSELCRELKHYKHWKNYDDFNEAIRDTKANEEYIDAFHFFMNIGIALGMDAHDIFEVYLSKNKENHVRQDEGYGFTDSKEFPAAVEVNNSVDKR